MRSLAFTVPTVVALNGAVAEAPFDQA
jgi:hypothetical protein